MKTKNKVKKIILVIIGLIASLIVGISGDMVSENEIPTVMEIVIYAILLIASVCYLHWLFQYFLIPISELDTDEKSSLKKRTSRYTSPSLNSLGYFFICLYIFELLIIHFKPESAENEINFVFIGLFFIFLGVFEKTRAVVRILINRLSEIRKNIEQASL